MDIQHYFEPVDFSKYYNLSHLSWKYTLGSTIEKYTNSCTPANIQKLKLAIVCVPFDSRELEKYTTSVPEKIREELYQLAKFETNIRIADFGNLKPATSVKGNYQALRDIVDFFHESEINVLIIGGSQDLSFGVCNAFQGNKYFSFSTIDAFFDIKKGKDRFNSNNYLSRIFLNHTNLIQFNLIAYQSHYVQLEK